VQLELSPTYRGKISLAILVALAFSAALFSDVLIFITFVVFFFIVLTGATWVIVCTVFSDRFFAASKSLLKESGPLFEVSTSPGEEIGRDFFFMKRARGKTILSSKIEYLKLDPDKIAANLRAVKVHATFKTPYSGEYQTDELSISVTDPLGFFKGNCSIIAPMNFIVYPKLLDIAITSMKILGRGGIGENPINAPGAGTEPYEMRNYQSGDDSRLINWKATARMGELIVMEKSREVGSSHYVVLEALASNYFDRDRLASTFLQLANSLTLNRARFGVIVHDGDHVTSLKRLGDPSDSLEFALNAALDFVDLKNLLRQTELSPLPSRILRSNRDALSMIGLYSLSKLEDLARSQLIGTTRKDPFKTIVGLAEENTEEPPAVFYICSLFTSIEGIVETGSLIKRIHGADFIVLCPVSPWVVARTEEEGVRLYETFSKNLEVLRRAQIKYEIGDPRGIVEHLLSA
jgi:hypothetical protein